MKMDFTNGSVQEQNQLVKQSREIKEAGGSGGCLQFQPTGGIDPGPQHSTPHQQQCTVARINVYIMGLPCAVIANSFIFFLKFSFKRLVNDKVGMFCTPSLPFRGIIYLFLSIPICGDTTQNILPFFINNGCMGKLR